MDPELNAGETHLLLQAWGKGDAAALNELIPLVYPRLRKLAAGFLRREGSGHTLDATSLVHEIYFRLVQQRKVEFQDREHFFSFAARLMRMILRDWARNRNAAKRGGTRVPLSDFLAWIDADSDEVLDLDRALSDLEQLDSRKVRLLELKVFLGCSTAEAAEMAGVSKATADRDLQLAKAWLFRRLRGSEASDPKS